MNKKIDHNNNIISSIDVIKKKVSKTEWSQVEEFYIQNKLFLISYESNFINIIAELISEETSKIKKYLSNGTLFFPTHKEVSDLAALGEKSIKVFYIAEYCFIQLVSKS